MNSQKLLDGKKISQEILKNIREQVADMPDKPNLAAILVGKNPSSHLYVKLKKKACEYCRIDFHRYLFAKNISQDEILNVIDFLNKDTETTGILVQLPLPKQFTTDEVIKKISLAKDVDGFHPDNLQKEKNDPQKIYSPLILGVMELLKSTNENLQNKKVVILCNHKIFGLPFLDLFHESNKIEILTLDDVNYESKTKEADILIVSIGRAKFIGPDKIKNNAIIVDIGINKIDGQIVGDVDTEQVLPKVKFITPVPGGVGPMTIAMLLQNLLKMKQNE